MGVGAAVLNFFIVYRIAMSAPASGGKSIAYIIPFAKIFVYAGVMLSAVLLAGLWSGVGAAAGCLSGPAAVIVSGMAVPQARRRRASRRGMAHGGQGASEEYIYEEHIRAADGSLRYVFAKGAYLQSYSGGRSYMTHRRFRKLKEIRAKDAASGGYGRGAGGGNVAIIQENSRRRAGSHG
ncbi:MAG: hypothetical protein LBG82_03060 [Clostridiales Family XIII bacterium]|nr:hypothetical protein [Clostridiales Family XIII bacterium]